jgi:Restriction Endonuclease associating with ARP
MNNDEDPKRVLLDHLPKEQILARYRRAKGNELTSKFLSPESSAALVANAFGIFLDGSASMPPPPAWNGPWQSARVLLEQEVRFPWRGGTHPWLDVVVTTDSHLIGIESKRYEPFRGSGKRPTLSEAYNRNVWGDRMRPFESLRDSLRAQPNSLSPVDAAQLVKHAFAIRTEGDKKGKQSVLLYLYAEPDAWADGRRISQDAIESHSRQVRKLLVETEGAEVRMMACSYRELLDGWLRNGGPALRAHADVLLRTFDIARSDGDGGREK